MPGVKSLSLLAPWFARICGNLQARVDTPDSRAKESNSWAQPVNDRTAESDPLPKTTCSAENLQPRSQPRTVEHPQQQQPQSKPQPPQQLPSELQKHVTRMQPSISKAAYAHTHSREVHIDHDTTVPYDLYKDLVRAGRRAKNRGQHELRESSSCDGTICRTASENSSSSNRSKMHLVRSSNSW
mmetsp:Transcript_141698/g.353314  ORF Transcript_141698/g.353314 Transcript_141698/m.353314 type:complete len:184 (-) Transcript_141698:116-667(-)